MLSPRCCLTIQGNIYCPYLCILMSHTPPKPKGDIVFVLTIQGFVD